LLDPQALVPLRHPLRPGERTHRQLPGIPTDREMCDADILGLAGAGGDDGSKAGGLPGVEGSARAGHRAALVRLDQRRIQSPLACRGDDAPSIGHQLIVADDLAAGTIRGGEGAQTLGIILRQQILDRENRIGVESASNHCDHALRVEHALAHSIDTIAAEFRGGNVERDADLHTRPEPRILDGARRVSSASSLVAKAGQNPPSSATPCSLPAAFISPPAAR